MNTHNFIFLGGLHRSGTSILSRCLSDHPDVSAFRDTGVSEDEGMLLQSVYPPGYFHGGPGRFGFHPDAHITEASPLASAANASRLFEQWSPYWDLDRRYLLEKSPPNLIRARFLQALFPRSRFVIIVRHPVAVAYATRKWSRTTLRSLLEHWFRCHDLLLSDAEFVEHLLVLKYETFIAEPAAHLKRIGDFLGLAELHSDRTVRTGINDAYFQRWYRLARWPLLGRYHRALCREFEDRAAAFGYSLERPDEVGPLPTSIRQRTTLSGRDSRSCTP